MNSDIQFLFNLKASLFKPGHGFYPDLQLQGSGQVMWDLWWTK
jgi:hypothetical protein